MTKSIEEWLEELPEPVKSRALYNRAQSDWVDKYTKDAPDMHGAIDGAFDWETSEEGEDFWSDVNSLLEESNYLDNGNIEWLEDNYPYYMQEAAVYPKIPTKFLEGIEL